VNVVFEKVEERVVYEVNGAVYVLFDAEEQLERPAGLVACREWYVG
jgi:hypothetical protein